MSLTNAMFVGFTGIQANTVGVDTVGNNLANLNTTSFKSQRVMFENLLYQTVREGEGPSATSGGTLPFQVGTGVGVSSLQRNFAQGGLDSTGVAGDLGIDGRGFFIVQQPGGEQAYTRDGAFHLDANGTLVSTGGQPLQVFAADAAGAIDTGSLGDLVIELGSASEPIPTSNVQMEGQLDSATEVASVPAVVASDPLVTAAGTPATASTALTDLVDGFGVPLFVTGDDLSVGGKKGGIAVAPGSFVVGTTGTTLGDLASHLETVLGIQTDPAFDGTAGVRVGDGTDAPAGALVVTSNLGEINAIELDGGSIVNNTSAVTSPFSFTTTQDAVGGGLAGTSTSFSVFDSLGNAVDVRLRLALESKSDAGTVWRFFAESNGDIDLSPVLGTGTLAFDATGKFISAAGTDLAIDRGGTGAATPLALALDFQRLTAVASPDGLTEFSMADQDGKPAGIMTGFSIDAEGVVTGQFSNADQKTLGQVALATFVNNEGLVALSENLYSIGPNSGAITVGAPGTGSAGSIRSGFLEQSNVEIAREFINLISASTGISAASRVVRASDDLLQELLLLAR
ncbi:MAG: flagellar hook protein FlgE [Phycisphaerae bacterium]